MAWYKNCDLGEARTPDYRFSVTSKDDPMLLALKEDISRHNKEIRARLREDNRKADNDPYNSILRVRLMARGPRAMYAKLDGRYARAYDSFIPHKYAKYFDVYAGTDSNAIWRFNYEMENGLTPGQHALIEREQRRIWEAESIMLRSLSKAGIARIGDKNGTRFVNAATHTPSALRNLYK